MLECRHKVHVFVGLELDLLQQFSFVLGFFLGHLVLALLFLVVLPEDPNEVAFDDAIEESGHASSILIQQLDGIDLDIAEDEF